ncbi:MAG TPA: hypothetical protein O0X23_05360, partial [Methanocorpusculum sp.]|nr:hypothetical protein [Methanocorpusculum sp.]
MAATDVNPRGSVSSFEGHGHLQMEFSLQPPPGWSEENPYPDNYEPVKPEGCYMFHVEGYQFDTDLYENKVKATMNCYIYDDLE